MVLKEIYMNYPLRAAVLAWMAAQIIKFIIDLIGYKKFDYTRLYGSGGMPSSHTSFVVALCVSIGKNYGFGGAAFAISAALAVIVMYDAAGVRRAAGKQAAAINLLFRQSGITLEKQFKELLGHTPLQVLAGAILGVAIGAAL